jgi:hypothetical protein
MKLTTIKEDSSRGAQQKLSICYALHFSSFANWYFTDRELLTRLTDISGTHASNGLGAPFEGNVVTHCIREKNVDATVTQTSGNLTAINAIHRL